MRKRFSAAFLIPILSLGAVLGFLVSQNNAWAGWYSISMDATIGARKPIHGNVKVLEGQEGIVSTPDTEIKMVPTSEGHHKWKIEVEAYRKTSTGLQKVSNSTLHVKEGAPAELSQSTEDGQLLFKIKLTLKQAR